MALDWSAHLPLVALSWGAGARRGLCPGRLGDRAARGEEVAAATALMVARAAFAVGTPAEGEQSSVDLGGYADRRDTRCGTTHDQGETRVGSATVTVFGHRAGRHVIKKAVPF